jgi:hypothetical protein
MKKILIILIVLIGFGAGLWQGDIALNIRINSLSLNRHLNFFILLAFLLALFFFFWKKLHKSKPWLWGTRIGFYFMIICFLFIIATGPVSVFLNYPSHVIIVRILDFFVTHFCFFLPGILLSGLGPYLFFRGLKERENKRKKVGLVVSGLLLILICLFLLLAAGFIIGITYYEATEV